MTKLINEKLVVLLPCQHAAVKEQEKELWNQTGTDLYGRPARAGGRSELLSSRTSRDLPTPVALRQLTLASWEIWIRRINARGQDYRSTEA